MNGPAYLYDAELRPGAPALRLGPLTGARSRILGGSAAMLRLFELIDQVGPTRATVLITGETGTGKELVARAIHEASERARRPFVPVNCSALPETLLESELFGHVRGSFTGAVANRRGLFEEASGGTLFLDEISTIPPTMQVKLLRVLQDRVLHRIGANQPVMVDFRLMAATNIDLAAEVAAGRFREDLYYRLNVFPVRVPPLRERPCDIPVLADFFRGESARGNGLPAPGFGAGALDRLAAYAWPGNVRELENYIERSVIMYSSTGTIPGDMAFAGGSDPEQEVLGAARRERWSIARLEQAYILDVLRQTGGHRGQAAEILGIDRRTLYRKLKQYAADGQSVLPSPE